MGRRGALVIGRPPFSTCFTRRSGRRHGSFTGHRLAALSTFWEARILLAGRDTGRPLDGRITDWERFLGLILRRYGRRGNGSAGPALLRLFCLSYYSLIPCACTSILRVFLFSPRGDWRCSWDTRTHRGTGWDGCIACGLCSLFLARGWGVRENRKERGSVLYWSYIVVF